jgi:site-specific DNA-methyltransferase (adenine-specific)
MEKPYIPFYKPYGMTDEEYQYEVELAQQKLAEWEQEQDNSVPFEAVVIPPTNTIENIDCMEMLKKCPDKHFDLAIVDPPYGILKIGQRFTKPSRPNSYKTPPKHKTKDWDNERPSKLYFEELIRVSRNQIIFGATNFTDMLPVNDSWIFWNKMNGEGSHFADGEFAWTSFTSSSIMITVSPFYELRGGKDRVHPTEKPVELYRKILRRFGKRGDLILDTHVGSGSSIVACIEGGFNYYGCEIDKDYYEAAQKRIARAFRHYELNFNNESAV